MGGAYIPDRPLLSFQRWSGGNMGSRPFGLKEIDGLLVPPGKKLVPPGKKLVPPGKA